MGTILLYVALTLVLLWTVRIARSKGRNPWLWGGLAFILMVIPNLNLLAVIPMIVLMFMKSSQQPSKTITESASCPKCRVSFLRNARYCTSCGWDLAERYYPEAVAEDEKSTVATQALEDREPVGVSDPVRQSPVHESPPAPAQESPPEAANEAEPETPTEVTPPPFTPRKAAGVVGPSHGRRHDGARGGFVQSGTNPRIHRSIHQSHRPGPQLRRGVGQAGRGLRSAG